MLPRLERVPSKCVRLTTGLIAAALFLVPATKASAREVFYVLVEHSGYSHSIKCYSHSGELQQTWPLFWTGSNRCAAMTTDGLTAWICHPYDDWAVSPVALRPGGGGGSCTVRTDVYGYNGGLAKYGDTMMVSRVGIYPMPSRIEWYNLTTGAYIDQLETGWWTGYYTMSGWTPTRMQIVGTWLLALGSGANVRALDLQHMEDEPLTVSLPPNDDYNGLAANSEFFWSVSSNVNPSLARAFTLGGIRRADQDVTFAGLGGTVSDLKIAWGPDESNIVVSPPATCTFPPTLVNGSSAATVRIRNVGNLGLVITAIGLSDTTNFARTNPSLPLTLTENQFVDLPVSFTPKSVGTLSADLTISSNDPDSGTLTVRLSGESINPRFYVDGDVAASGNGKTWATAFKSISDAVGNAGVLDGSEIWVKSGTYTLAATIQVSKRLAIYGGFAGGESTLSARDWRTNTTTIDGNNAVACMRLSGSDVTVDGFTITRGHNTSNQWPTTDGAGVVITGARAAVRNCIVSSNRVENGGGAGIFTSGATSVEIVDCEIASNWSMYDGGGIAAGSNTTMRRCRIRGNTARMGAGINAGYISGVSIRDCIITGNTCTLNNPPVAGGGGVALWSVTSSEVVNCLLTANTGGGIESYLADPVITNCTVAGNTGGGIISHYSDATPVITNCIVWGNTGYQIDNQSGASPNTTYCDVDQDFYGVWGTGNPDAHHNMRKAPLFFNAATGSYRLTATSPIIGMGNSAVAPAADLAGVARPAGGCAMGAYEYAPPAPTDFDNDFDVDEDDLTALNACASGPGVPGSSGCEAMDLDHDNDVDQSDFGLFQRCLSGSGVEADPACAD